MSETEVPYGVFARALEAVHSALQSIAAAPPGHKVTGQILDWNEDGTLAALKFYDDSDLLFTLTFSYDDQKRLTQIVRS
jgi:hypothetical protein